MPANLTPDYHRAEARFRSAKTVRDRLEALEEMLRIMPKHKGTDGLQADIKARIAKLRKQPEKKGARASHSWLIPSEGAGQVVLVGPPNTGKSSLVRFLTHATPDVAEYPFTTREPTPGMMSFEDVGIQLIDLPPLCEEHVEPWVYDLVRHSDLVWLVLDGLDPMDEMDLAIRLLAQKRIALEPVDGASGVEEAADAAVVRPAMLVVTGVDKPGVGEALPLFEEWLEGRWPWVAVSASTGRGMDDLRRKTFAALRVMRVYTKQPGKAPDRDTPFTLPIGSTVGDLAARIHKDILATMKFARIWGPSAFDGQTVQRDHVLAEGDVVEIHL